MNKKYLAVIVGIILAIGVIVLSNNLVIPNNESVNKPIISNDTNSSSTKTGNHFNIELHESVGIKAKP
ncbi:MAG: hypothetical protein ACREBA_08675 [Nitrosotalea sp.]